MVSKSSSVHAERQSEDQTKFCAFYKKFLYGSQRYQFI